VTIVLGSFALIARAFKILCLALFAYVAEVIIVQPGFRTLAIQTLIPHFQLSRSYFALLVAVLGTTISPYLFFWQSAHRIEELREEPKGGDRAVPLKEDSSTEARTKKRTSRFDVFTGMALSNFVMWSIIVVTAQTLWAHGQRGVTSAAQAASALTPIAGRFASILFALGFVGTGFLAVPVLAGAGAVGMAGLFKREWGFSRSLRNAPVFYGLVIVGTLGGTLLSLIHVDPIKLLVIVAGINGIAAAPFLTIVMLISSNQRLMGEHRNGTLATTLGWLTVAVMGLSALSLLLMTGSR
jgi:Mn2+/Fe2+ NRAMP family transporter